ncbi:MAG: winged helix-turn-helix domain-containing protein [Archaeoglobaceae archaeon]
MHKRSKYEIISEILKISNSHEGANITRIVYSANLNFKNAQKIISELVKNGLLEVLNGSERKKYRTTEKGIEFIANYESLSSVYYL